jgi:hypothetical protein
MTNRIKPAAFGNMSNRAAYGLFRMAGPDVLKNTSAASTNSTASLELLFCGCIHAHTTITYNNNNNSK